MWKLEFKKLEIEFKNWKIGELIWGWKLENYVQELGLWRTKIKWELKEINK